MIRITIEGTEKKDGEFYIPYPKVSAEISGESSAGEIIDAVMGLLVPFGFHYQNILDAVRQIVEDQVEAKNE